MSIDGTWGFVYWGETGVGFGVIVMIDGRLHGSDQGGLKYAGTAAEDAQTKDVHLSVDVAVPPGIDLVEGTDYLSDVPTKRHFELDLPPRLGELTPVDISVLPGKTGILFKGLPDQWTPFANGFTVTPKE